MTADAYKQAFEKARKDLLNAIHQRDQWTLEIAKLQPVVKSLAGRLQEQGSKISLITAESYLIPVQELVLACVRGSITAVSAMDVRDKLDSIGYDLSKYSNPLAVIHGALNRLEKAGDITSAGRGKFTVGIKGIERTTGTIMEFGDNRKA
jgi:hypothetical protein